MLTFVELLRWLNVTRCKPLHLRFWDPLVPYGEPGVFTSQEVNDFAAFRGRTDKALPEEPRIVCVGPEFMKFKRSPKVRYLRTPHLARPYIAGMMYLSARALRQASEDFLTSVCKHVYDYNYVVRRYRPDQPLRFVHLLSEFGKRDAAQALHERLERQYPGATCLTDQTCALATLRHELS